MLCTRRDGGSERALWSSQGQHNGSGQWGTAAVKIMSVIMETMTASWSTEQLLELSLLKTLTSPTGATTRGKILLPLLSRSSTLPRAPRVRKWTTQKSNQLRTLPRSARLLSSATWHCFPGHGGEERLTILKHKLLKGYVGKTYLSSLAPYLDGVLK